MELDTMLDITTTAARVKGEFQGDADLEPDDFALITLYIVLCDQFHWFNLKLAPKLNQY